MIGNILLLIICCIIPLLISLATAGLVAVKLRSGNDTFATNNYIRALWSWMNIFTFRSTSALSFAVIFFLLAFLCNSPEIFQIVPMSLIATMAFFLIFLCAIFISIAFFAKSYYSVKSLVIGKSSITETSLSNTEIVENDPAVIKTRIKMTIPWGYILRISQKLPAKLGGELRAISTSTKNGIAEFEATLPYTRRGIYTIGPITFTYQDVFGFSKINMQDNTRFKLTILPEIPRVNHYNFQLSSTKGDRDEEVVAQINTQEYYGTRPYVRGDDMRHMNWKLSAKHDKLIIRTPETTNITFKNLTIIIFNTAPRLNSQDKQMYKKGNTKYAKVGEYVPFKTAVELALDYQIRVAGALIDYAQRLNIPTHLYYFQNGKLVHYIPQRDNATEWKHKLTAIDLETAVPNMVDVAKVLSNDNASIITMSEVNTTIMGTIMNTVSKYKSSIEIMYCPVSTQMRKHMGFIKKDSKASKFLKVIKLILFTKPYFQQTTIPEKIVELLSTRNEIYTENNITTMETIEKRVLTQMLGSDSHVRAFDSKEDFASESDEIVSILENNHGIQ